MQTMVVPLGRNGKYGQLTCDCTRFAEHVQQHVWAYGLRQCLNDAIASKKDDDGKKLTNEQLLAKAQKRLDTLYAGELRATRTTCRAAFGPEAEAYRLAWADITRDVKSLAEYAETKGEKDRVMATVNLRDERAGRVARTREGLIEAVLAVKPTYMAAAKKIVAEREKVTGDLGIDV